MLWRFFPAGIFHGVHAFHDQRKEFGGRQAKRVGEQQESCERGSLRTPFHSPDGDFGAADGDRKAHLGQPALFSLVA